MVVLLSVMAAALLLMAGCGEQEAPQQDNAKRQNASKEQAAPEKARTVVVNEGMSKKEEEKLNERLAELEEKVDEQPRQETTDQGESEEAEQGSGGAEEQALQAARDYYAAAAAGDYGFTYDALAASAKSQFSEEDWVEANTELGSDAASYDVYSADMVDDATAEVGLTVNLPDGSSDVRNTLFVYQDGEWKHELTQTEYDLFAGATASASPGASADGDTKHVEVVITSNKPADVSISDDSLNWYITEEIVGTETYERDIATSSGLSVSATTDAYQAQTTIEVYENGELVAQDSDPNGFAVVNY